MARKSLVNEHLADLADLPYDPKSSGGNPNLQDDTPVLNLKPPTQGFVRRRSCQSHLNGGTKRNDAQLANKKTNNGEQHRNYRPATNHPKKFWQEMTIQSESRECIHWHSLVLCVAGITLKIDDEKKNKK